MVVETGSWDHEILWARWIPSTTELKKKKKVVTMSGMWGKTIISTFTLD